jgi:transposase-like protein
VGAAIKDRFFSPRARVTKRDRERWREMARREVLRCPACDQSWLVVGARANDRHTCKSCHHNFVVMARVTAEI